MKCLVKNDPNVETSGLSKIDKLSFALVLALEPSDIGEAGSRWVPVVPHQRENKMWSFEMFSYAPGSDKDKKFPLISFKN